MAGDWSMEHGVKGYCGCCLPKMGIKGSKRMVHVAGPRAATHVVARAGRSVAATQVVAVGSLVGG
jgi:hypothetical protein